MPDAEPPPEKRPSAHPTEPIARPDATLDPPGEAPAVDAPEEASIDLPLDAPAVGPARPAPANVPSRPSPAGVPSPSQPDATDVLPVAEATSPARRPDEPEREPLPDLEEITFPRQDAAPPAVTAPRKPRGEDPRAPASPPPEGATLSRRRYATLTAFAEALIPPGGQIAPSGVELGIPERVDASLRALAPEVRDEFARALSTIEWSSLFGRFVRPFSRLGRGARTSEIARARTGRNPARRRAAERLAWLCLNQWAATPVIEEAIGFSYACVSSDPPREALPLEVLGYPQVFRDTTEECDVVVVGSGAGGAVVAKELAEIGMSVVVVEEGSALGRRDFGGPPLDRALRLYRRHRFTEARGVPDVALPMGFGLGGSTLVSAGTAVRAPDPVLVRWGKELGIPGVEPESLRPFVERVERAHRVQPVPDELLGANARALARGAKELGVHAGVVQRTIEGCRGCGTCTVGCPTDAKLGTNLTYLPRAQRHGATIYAGARAMRILIEDGRARGIVASLRDPRTHEERATLTVRAKVVVIAAGSIHTPALLSDNALGNRSGQLGRNLHLQPSATVGAFFPDDVHAWRGTEEAFAVDGWLESHHVVVASSAPIPSVAAGTFPGAGAPLKDMLTRLPTYASATVSVTDTSRGTVARRAGHEPAVRYRLNQADTRRLVRGIANTAELFLAAGARAVHTGLHGLDPVTSMDSLRALKEEDVRAGSLRLESRAPGGSARMGADPATSVVDPWGEVHGVPGLFVADASVLPTPLGVPPQITVMALATRAADYLARRAGEYF